MDSQDLHQLIRAPLPIDQSAFTSREARKMISHDGLRDSLTNLVSAPFLYEELRRELARVKRRGESIFLIRLILVINSGRNVEHSLSKRPSSAREILLFSHSLTHVTREEDICARMGEVEFLCSMNTSNFQVEAFVERLIQEWKAEIARETKRFTYSGSRDGELRLSYSGVKSLNAETVLELLDRLDRAPLETIHVT
jgi:GGDEF domain-containing protein